MSAELGWRDLVTGWERAVSAPDIRSGVESSFELIRRTLPIDSLVVIALDETDKSLVTIGASGKSGQAVRLMESRRQSEARWNAIEPWSKVGEGVRQFGSRRTGKLAWIAPAELQNEVLVFPCHSGEASESNLSPTGVAVYEMELWRGLNDEQFELLPHWSTVLWLFVSRHSERAMAERMAGGAGVSSAGAAESGGRTDEAREAIVGSETGLKSVMDRVQLVAPSDMPVLILGDTGTGKEVVARAIHSRSPRNAKPFIRVNCGAIPPELIDSQLFGHERGSFTGASDLRKGWFERADGGTLFLDEMGELPLAAQVRLLRVLQEQQIERVGGQESIRVDVRIVAATHRDLSVMVHQKTFREDLWYRINMFPILLPRLCERIEDIPALARHFARKAANRFGLPYVEPGPAEIKQLVDYRWPGNIRELQAVIDRAVILGGGTKLDVAKSLGNSFMQPTYVQSIQDEPTFYEVIPESPPRIAPAADRKIPDDPGQIDSLAQAISGHIERALVSTNGQIEGKRGAAKLLGVNPHTLRAKMRKLGIDWNRFRPA